MADSAKVTTDNPTSDSPTIRGDDRFRFNLAKWVIIFAFTVIGVLGVGALLVVWRLGAQNDPFGHVKDILSMLLPIIGTWVGVVLAFYFGKDNFETAARNTASLVERLTPDEKLRSVSVKDAMIPIEKAVVLTLSDDLSTIKLKADMIGTLEKDPNAKKERLPMLNKEGLIMYIAHKSIINDFIRKTQDSTPPNADPSLADMLADAEVKSVLTSFGKLRPTATLAEAKVLMDNIEKCADVFITADGTQQSKVIGWITDSDIQKQSIV